MRIDVQENGLYMLFELDEENRLNLRHMGAAPYTGDDNKFRAPLQLITNPGSGHWAKHINTDILQLQYVEHDDFRLNDGRLIEFRLKDDTFEVVLHYRFYNGCKAVRSWTTVENISEQPQYLYHLSSFHYNGIGADDCTQIMQCHNGWSQEFIPEIRSPMGCGLLTDAKNHNTTKKITVSNTGTWSTKDYMPIGYAAGPHMGCLFWQIESSTSWGWEVSNNDDNLYINLSGPSEENSWYKVLQPGQSFRSVIAAVSVGEDFNAAMTEMTRYRRCIKGRNADYDRHPVLFNDYLHCLNADPTTEKVLPMVDWAAKQGAEYYIMDAGWFSDGHWWDTIGEWDYAETRFTNGLSEIFRYIRKKGLKPGIWVEPESMGVDCPLASQWPDECFFTRHGKRMVYKGRLQLDFRHPTVIEHLTNAIDRLIRDLGIRYFKFDYNIDAGCGTDVDSDSFGDGLMKSSAAFDRWMDDLMFEYPDVIFESCASGGMRIDYNVLSRFQIQSTSDNVDFKQTAVIVSNSALAVVPEQAGVWVFPLEDMTENEVVFAAVSGLAATPYLSGRPDKQGDNFHLLPEATGVYLSYRDKVSGFLPFWPLGFNHFDEKKHCVAYKANDGKIYLALWQTEAVGPIELPIAANRVHCLYPILQNYKMEANGSTVTIDLGDRLNAGWFILD